MSKPLLQKNTRLLLTWLPIVLLACSVLFYFMMQMFAHHMQEEQLILKQKNVWNAFIGKSGNIEKYIQGEYEINTEIIQHDQLDILRDTTIYFKETNQATPFDMLTSRIEWQNKKYYITTYVSATEVHHLIIWVLLTDVAILILLLGTIVIVNRINSALLWKPFFESLDNIKDYSITNNPSLKLPEETEILEFDQLNKVLNNLIENITTAYNNQKQFVENASHEIQTPLSIIRSKLELLINQPQLTEKEALILADITHANDRLSQMNRTLLLLAKIENKQFPSIEIVNLEEIISESISQLKEHYGDEFPDVLVRMDKNVTVKANKTLIEIMISNLFKNAIIHNVENGKIKIELGYSSFTIENTGKAPEADTLSLFERFKKGSHQSRTTGLGLAIVKQICNLYQFSVNYSYSEGWHRIKIVII